MIDARTPAYVIPRIPKAEWVDSTSSIPLNVDLPLDPVFVITTLPRSR